MIDFVKFVLNILELDKIQNVPRERESDILELSEQFGALLVHRSDRLPYTVPEALEILSKKNMAGIKNVFLSQFEEFVDIMEDMQVMHLGLNVKITKRY